MVAMYLQRAVLLVLVAVVVQLPHDLTIIKSTSAAVFDQLAMPGCPHQCGGVDIPYPFGLSENCSLISKFYINCSTNTPQIGNIEVTNISVELHEITIRTLVGRICFNESGLDKDKVMRPSLNLSLLTISRTAASYSMGCMSICKRLADVRVDDGSCSGIGCCEIKIPEGLKNVTIRPRSFNNHTGVMSFNPCTYAFVVENNRFNFTPDLLRNFTESRMPLVAEWLVPNNDSLINFASGVNNTVKVPTGDGFKCTCKDGYEGNPYLPTGCQGNIYIYIYMFFNLIIFITSVNLLFILSKLTCRFRKMNLIQSVKQF